ncbi:unnamed protein product [Rhizoctonia solani]|uniref:Uncharacterized protein n=1 Tax=Rhizoctonia solani TaxID=456999 RepID=A0A8H2X6Q8_9AGAM|nr:unnamed protein product [Rhizoctonia solani]
MLQQSQKYTRLLSSGGVSLQSILYTGLLYNESKDAVVLYVSHGNPAEKIYHRIGYTGLCGAPRPAIVEDWLEVGFQNTIRGHW